MSQLTDALYIGIACVAVGLGQVGAAQAPAVPTARPEGRLLPSASNLPWSSACEARATDRASGIAARRAKEVLQATSEDLKACEPLFDEYRERFKDLKARAEAELARWDREFVKADIPAMSVEDTEFGARREAALAVIADEQARLEFDLIAAVCQALAPSNDRLAVRYMYLTHNDMALPRVIPVSVLAPDLVQIIQDVRRECPECVLAAADLDDAIDAYCAEVRAYKDAVRENSVFVSRHFDRLRVAARKANIAASSADGGASQLPPVTRKRQEVKERAYKAASQWDRACQTLLARAGAALTEEARARIDRVYLDAVGEHLGLEWWPRPVKLFEARLEKDATVTPEQRVRLDAVLANGKSMMKAKYLQVARMEVKNWNTPRVERVPRQTNQFADIMLDATLPVLGEVGEQIRACLTEDQWKALKAPPIMDPVARSAKQYTLDDLLDE